MKCRYCNKEPDAVYMIPEDPDSMNIIKSPLCCRKCGLEKGVICRRHEVAHMSFVGGGHACKECIDETAQELSPHADAVIQRFNEVASYTRFREIELWAERSSAATGKSVTVSFMCAIATSYQILSSEKTEDLPDPFAGNFFEVYGFVDLVLESLDKYPLMHDPSGTS